MPSIQPLHTKVSGRARFKIPGLRHEPGVKQYLEHQLSRDSAIIKASASCITGNLLVSYNSNNNHHSVAVIIQQIVQTYIQDSENSVVSQRVIRPRRGDNSKGKQRQARPKTNSTPLPIPPETGDNPKWHLMESRSILETLHSSDKLGLSDRFADSLLKEYGPNLLPEAEPRSGWQIFLNQMNSLPVYLLGAAAGVSVLTGGLFDAAVIMGVVVANAVVGYFTESAAEKTIHSLKSLVRPHAEVIRDGKTRALPVQSVVAGDILVFKPGAYVAADARILSAAHLSIDESMLTGESLPVDKHAGRLTAADIALADRTNMAYMGTLVTGGQGLAVVVATGEATQIGHIQMMLNRTETPETPIERQLRQMGDHLVLMCGGICSVVFLIGLLQGYGFLTMLRMAISLAAAAVPEGLPAAATINFALGIKKLRKHRVLIRHLHAVETLGAVQAICMDKTGTITRNLMTVQRICAGEHCYNVANGRLTAGNASSADPSTDEGLLQLITACALCHEVKLNGTNASGQIELFGSATEKALVQLAIDAGFNIHRMNHDYRRLEINHRSENRLFMSTLHRTPENDRIGYTKGSPPEVLAMCSSEAVNGAVQPLTDARRLSIESENEKMASAALRVLGFAYKRFSDDTGVENDSDLVWLGLVGMADPIRPGVQPLIQVFHRAGIDTIMITGDQSSTAFAIAEQLNLAADGPIEILDSSNLSAVNPETLKALATKAHVYSRVSPAHKLQIVQALQSAGVTVAMTGDGINDGPALKAADIGIAMGKTGTDVARDVADMVLEEDDLETLALALKDGRTIHVNIRKSVHFFLSTNISEIILMTAAMALGIGFPLNVMQLLWINIISDIFPGLALAMEEAEDDVMSRPPRQTAAPLFSAGDFLQMTRESAAITGGALAAYGYGIARYGLGSGAASLAFQSLTIAQLLHAISCRSEHASLFGRRKTAANPYLRIAVGGSLALQALTMVFPPLRSLLGLKAPALMDLAVIAGTSVLPLLFNEAAKTKSHIRKPEVEGAKTPV
ncbi:MAG: HAD-IC family P-type ATPase [Desulfobacterales bacterium]|jgi:Ca2+-transporting ATPase|nr:HAD-IC family P-type ATPase [Desulfobacterales bacterium]